MKGEQFDDFLSVPPLQQMDEDEFTNNPPTYDRQSCPFESRHQKFLLQVLLLPQPQPMHSNMAFFLSSLFPLRKKDMGSNMRLSTFAG